jgi:hypothetical protein
MVIQHITEQLANAALTDPIAKLSAIPFTLSLDDVVSWAATLLPSEELDIPNRDVPMEEPPEARGILEPPQPEEIVMQGVSSSSGSCSPHPPDMARLGRSR